MCAMRYIRGVTEDDVTECLRPEYRRLRTTEQLGRALRDARRSVGHTQETAAGAAGMSRSHVARIESGQHNVSHQTLNRLLEAIGYDMSIYPRARRHRAW